MYKKKGGTKPRIRTFCDVWLSQASVLFYRRTRKVASFSRAKSHMLAPNGGRAVCLSSCCMSSSSGKMSSGLPSPHDNCSSYYRLCEEFPVEADSDQSEAECAASNNDLQSTVALDMDAALLCRLLTVWLCSTRGCCWLAFKNQSPRAAWCVLSAIFGGERWDYSRPRIRGNVAEGAAGRVGEGKERQGSRQTRNRYWQGIEHR